MIVEAMKPTTKGKTKMTITIGTENQIKLATKVRSSMMERIEAVKKLEAAIESGEYVVKARGAPASNADVKAEILNSVTDETARWNLSNEWSQIVQHVREFRGTMPRLEAAFAENGNDAEFWIDTVCRDITDNITKFNVSEV